MDGWVINGGVAAPYWELSSVSDEFLYMSKAVSFNEVQKEQNDSEQNLSHGSKSWNENTSDENFSLVQLDRKYRTNQLKEG